MMRSLILLSFLSLLGCYAPGPRLYHPVVADVWCDHKVAEADRRHLIVHAVDPFERVEVYRQDGTLLLAADCWTTMVDYCGAFPEGIHNERLTIIVYFRKFDDRVKILTYIRPL